MTSPDIAFSTIVRDNRERFQPLRRELGVSSFGMNLIVLQPGQRGRIHAHEHQEEVFLVLEGRLTLLVEGVEHVLGPDRLVRIGPCPTTYPRPDLRFKGGLVGARAGVVAADGD